MVRILGLTLTIFFTCLNSLLCASPYDLVDYYQVVPGSKFGIGFHLACKLSCENDPRIELVSSVFWNDEMLIVEQVIESKQKWFIIQARGKSLLCCNEDKVSGPFTDEKILNLINDANRHFHYKKFQ